MRHASGPPISLSRWPNQVGRPNRRAVRSSLGKSIRDDADDVFTIHHGWLAQFAAEMKRRGLSIPFECISRADRINERVADLLAELNCFRIWIGSESGSQRVLDAMRRGVTVQQVQNAVGLCKSRGIQTGMFLMWGYEGEEWDDIQATIQHVKVSNPDIFLTTVAYPIRGTSYFEAGAGPRGKSEDLGGELRPGFSNPRQAFPPILSERRSSPARGS